QAGAWGAVHVLPETDGSQNLRVEGEILNAESHTLKLRIRVVDATGAQWFNQIYTEHVGTSVLGDDAIGVNDPFDGLYNRVANDMLSHARANLDAADIAQIRQVAALQFGNTFAPEVYGSCLP